MDTSEYLPMFLAESREHLQDLNLAVVRIEETPQDRATVDEIFRIAHSLKGMSATMGFDAIAALTHQMEDVFELLRQREDGLEREAVDALFKCLDALEVAVEQIAADGADRLEPAALIEQLRSLMRERTPEQELERMGGVALPDLARVRELAAGRRVAHVVAELAEDASMPAVRAFMYFSALAGHGTLVGSIPAQESVEQFDGNRLEAWLVSERDDTAIAAVARAVPDVAHVVVHEAQDDLMPPSREGLAAAHAAAEPVVVADGASPSATRPPVPPAAPPPTAPALLSALPEPPPPAPAPVPARARAAVRRATDHAAARPGATVRVDAERLDQLMHFMGELVIHRTVVETLAADAAVPGLPQAIQDLVRSSQALQAMVMQVRMVPVDAVFLRLPRLVRDLSARLGKTVELRLVGQETEFDRTVVDALGDPLVHLVRNALDHGLEAPHERVAAGKPRAGLLEISARHAGGNVIIEVRDDGRGIDPARVARKAWERGLIGEEAVDGVDVARAVELLFAPGFSTAETTNDVSGRGVGMDAVRATIRELGGEVLVASQLGGGMTAQIRLPLTLAIMAALLVQVEGTPFAIPLDRVERTLRLEDHTVRSVAGARMLVLGDGVLPLLDAGATLAGRTTPSSEPHDHAVIVRGLDRRFALAVGRLVGQRELVTRPLPPEVSERAAVSGGAVLSDGQIALIVDCDALSARAGAAHAAPAVSVPETAR